MTRATLTKDPHDVSRMFDAVARRYDVTNDLMSLFQVRMWRSLTRAEVRAAPGMTVLDVAAGTGTSSMDYLADGAHVVACDFSAGMVAEGKMRHPELEFVTGDATALPFADESFDVTTISYGLRNVHDTLAALSEMRRVTKTGGRLVIAEFSTPTLSPIKTAYHTYLSTVLPAIARIASSNPEAYDYFGESIVAWPDQRALAHLMYEAGWHHVAYKNITGGLVALHRATK